MLVEVVTIEVVEVSELEEEVDVVVVGGGDWCTPPLSALG